MTLQRNALITAVAGAIVMVVPLARLIDIHHAVFTIICVSFSLFQTVETRRAMETTKEVAEQQYGAIQTMLHNLRTPLADLELHTRLLVGDVGDAEERAWLPTVVKMQNLITEMVSFCDKMTTTERLEEEIQRFKERVQQSDADTLCEPMYQSTEQAETTSKQNPVEEGNEASSSSKPDLIDSTAELTILLVDDSTTLRNNFQRYLTHVLRLLGHSATFLHAETGEAAIQIVLPHNQVRHDISMIVCDQYMHDKGGKLLGSETVDHLRRAGYRRLVLGCSGNVSSKVQFEQAGADYFWTCVPSMSIHPDVLPHPG